MTGKKGSKPSRNIESKIEKTQEESGVGKRLRKVWGKRNVVLRPRDTISSKSEKGKTQKMSVEKGPVIKGKRN